MTEKCRSSSRKHLPAVFRRMRAMHYLLGLIIIISALAALDAWFYHIARQRAVGQFTRSLAQQCLSASQILHQQIHLAALEGQSLASHTLPAFLLERESIAPVSAAFERALAAYPHLLAVTVTDEAGGLIYARGRETALGDQAVNLSLSWAKNHLEQAMGHQDFFIPPVSVAGSPQALGIIAPVKLENEPAGLLVMVLDGAGLCQHPGAADTATLAIDSTGHIFGPARAGMPGKKLTDVVQAALYQRIMTETQGMGAYTPPSGLPDGLTGEPGRQLAAWRAISAGGQRLAVIMSAPQSAALQLVLELRRQHLFLLALLLIILAGLVVLLLSPRADAPPASSTLNGGMEDAQLKRLLFELSPAGIVRYDRNLRITDCNNRLAQIMDSQPGQLAGYDLHTNFDQRLQAVLSEALQGREAAYEGEFVPKRGARPVFISVKSAPILDETRAIAGALAVVEDLAPRKQHEEDRIRLHNLESTGVLVGGIAHDFNNILALILGNVILARQYLPFDSRALDKLQKSERAVDQAKNLMQRLLVYASNQNPSMEQCSLYDLIIDTVQFHLSGSNVRPEIDLAEDLGDILCDSNQIAQALGSIITIAKEAMPMGGIVHINAQRVQAGPDEVPSLEPGPYARIIIQDYGHGIPRELLPQIFEPYFSTKTRGGRKGAGLGLATALSIIRQHYGHIAADSTEGLGATFTIWLPVS